MENPAQGEDPKKQPAVNKLSSKRELPPEVRSLIRRLQKNYSFFSDLEESEVGQFLRLCKREKFEKGKTIFQQGESGEAFFLIVSGEISIIVGEKEVARIGQGQLLGEMAMLDSSPRSATAQADEDTIVFSIARNVLTKRMPGLSYKVVVNIAKQLGEKLRESNEIINKMKAQAEG
ncbi:MAG: cyclic nucleotide-binding domain-containing protein [bacterium]